MERLNISKRIDLYDDEECVAEFSSMIICLLLGIDVWSESYKYLSDYMTNSDGMLIMKGRQDYILNFSIQLIEYMLKFK